MKPFDKDFAREKLLARQYGQFDLIEYFFAPEQITASKPRVLMQQIIKYFELPKNAINPTGFRAWLRRYKMKYTTALNDTHIEQESQNPLSNEEWKDFKLSDSSDIKLKETIIKVIKNNKQQ